jgi:GNAT superfamily N-acetyltransferase
MPASPAESDGGVRLRAAQRADVALVHALLGELADYERLRHAFVASVEDIDALLFASTACAEAVLAEVGAEVAGFALFFHNISSFAGRRGIFIEDLYVRPEHRGRGVGGALLRHLIELARDRRCARLEWSVLNWNRSAIEFYERLGARPVEGWTVYRLDADALRGGGDHGRDA